MKLSTPHHLRHRPSPQLLAPDLVTRIISVLGNDPHLDVESDIIEILHSTGMQQTELSRLSMSDIDFANSRLFIFGSPNGRHERCVPISLHTINAIKRLLAQFPDSSMLLGSSPRTQLHRACRAFHRIASELGIKTVGPYSLRSSFASEFINSCLNVEELK
jgi:site-specific recombinase XerD